MSNCLQCTTTKNNYIYAALFETTTIPAPIPLDNVYRPIPTTALSVILSRGIRLALFNLPTTLLSSPFFILLSNPGLYKLEFDVSLRLRVVPPAVIPATNAFLQVTIVAVRGSNGTFPQEQLNSIKTSVTIEQNRVANTSLTGLVCLNTCDTLTIYARAERPEGSDFPATFVAIPTNALSILDINIVLTKVD